MFQHDHFLSDRGIVHRDLKPENIMMASVERDDEIVIGDFGLSKFAAPHEIMKLPCGTLAYVAPEVCVSFMSYPIPVSQIQSLQCMRVCVLITFVFYLTVRC